MRQLILEFVLALGFTGTTGFLFSERFKRNYFLSTIVALLLFSSTFLTIREMTKFWYEFTRPEARIPPDKYPTPVPSYAADEVFWLSIKDSTAPGLFDEFIRKFPSSAHIAEARDRLRASQQGSTSSPKVCLTFNNRQYCD